MGVPGSGCSRLSLGSGPPRLSGHQAHTGRREQLVALGSAGAALLCQYAFGLCCPCPWMVFSHILQVSPTLCQRRPRDKINWPFWVFSGTGRRGVGNSLLVPFSEFSISLRKDRSVCLQRQGREREPGIQLCPGI